MSEKKGLIRRFFSLIGKLVRAIRTLISLIILLIFLAIIGSLFQEKAQPLPDKAALRLALGGVLVDEKTRIPPLAELMNPDDPIDSETLVSDLIEAIDKAATDDRITSLVLELDYLLGGGISKMEEIGVAIEQFKTSGKPVIAVGDNYSQQQYFLASFADEIYLNPMGTVLLTGFGAYPTYMKDALDKLKISVNIFRVGSYKDAIEPFTRNNMSAASREHTAEWLNSLWDVYTSRVETSRNLPADAIDDYANNFASKLAASNGDTAALALETGLVDHIATRPEILNRLQGIAGKDNGGYQYIDYKRYLGANRALPIAAAEPKQPQTPTIGVIVAKGTIIDGFGRDGSIGSDDFSALLQQAREENPAALVIRIDSPGGSAFAAEVIRNEIEITRNQGIPVVVSMGSVAASGGYWIATAANEIWATPTTITGSIGVFGVIPTFENSLQSLGIHSDGVGTTQLADFYQLDRPMSDAAKTIVQLSVENIYQQFLQLVADSRNSTPATIHTVAQGRVWTGEKAKELGLVDKLGNMEDAITAAAKLADLNEFEVRKIRPPLSFQEQFLEALSQSETATSFFGLAQNWLPQALKSTAQRIDNSMQMLSTMNDPRGLYLQCFECAGISR